MKQIIKIDGYIYGVEKVNILFVRRPFHEGYFFTIMLP
jgi:hypothetical protein